MISTTAIVSNHATTTTTTTTLASSDEEIYDLEQQLRFLDAAIAPLAGKSKKKLAKVEEELANCNFLIDSGIGSKADQLGLRKTKRQLRQRRIKFWDELEALPALEIERKEAIRQLNAARRLHGILLNDE